MIKVEEYVCGGREDHFHIYGAARQGSSNFDDTFIYMYIHLYYIIDIYYNIYKFYIYMRHSDTFMD